MADTIVPVKIAISTFKEEVIYRNLIVQTEIGTHHSFSFIWNVGKVKNSQSFQLDVIKQNIGATVTIQFDNNEFTGIITSLAVEDVNSATQSFVVSGSSLSVLLDDVPECASYYQNDLKTILNAALEGVPDNVLQKDINTTDNTKYHYITQYNETDFRFIQRLSQRYGQWLFVDNQKLVFGKPGDKCAELKAGTDTRNFVMEGVLRPYKYNYKTYDAYKGEAITKEAGSFSSAGNDFADAAINASKSAYSRSAGRPQHALNAVNTDMAAAISKLQLAANAVNTLRVRGESSNPDLKAGCKFSISTESGKYDYIATNVVHYSRQRGHYENTFQAVVGSAEVPPYTDPTVFRVAAEQYAIVKENHDTDGLNRIKVQFPWQKSSALSPWIRVATPHAGENKGWHFIPENSEEVLIGFEGGDVDKPYMLAAHFHGSAKSKINDADNNIKSLITKSGNTLTFNDKEGSITITDPKGSTIILKGDETIEIKSKKKILIQTKDVQVDAENDIVFKAKNNISFSATKNIELSANEAMSLKSMKALSAKSSSDAVTIEGMKDVSVKSGASNVSIEATMEFKAKGTTGATVEGLKLDLKGSAMASLQAALVKIN